MTKDYSGSCDKEAVIQYLTTHNGFRLQGSKTYTDRAILDNCEYVGNNCLTYMETVHGTITRCKMYNKMVQMLEK